MTVDATALAGSGRALPGAPAVRRQLRSGADAASGPWCYIVLPLAQFGAATSAAPSWRRILFQVGPACTLTCVLTWHMYG